MTRELLWVSLPDQRPRRELHYMSLMPDTRVTALAADEPLSDVAWIQATYRRPIKRFIEAGALAWVNELSELDPTEFDWVASLELCSLVTGQASKWRRRSKKRPLQAVITWENLVNQPLYKIPPYRNAFNAARSADLLLCMVDAARDHLLANGFDDELIRVVKPGVDTEVFYPAEQVSQDPVVVFISPLAENKGIDRVLEAMRFVRREMPEARLEVAGRGPLTPLVEAAAADPSEQVTLHGNLTAQEVGAVLRRAAVFITAPRPTWKWEEQFGLAYVEAQASGIPVVTTRCGSNHEALASGNDLLDDDSPESLATSLLRWLKDDGARAAQGKANRDWAVTNHDLLTQCALMGQTFAEMERIHGR